MTTYPTPEPILDAVRGYVMELKPTLGNWRFQAERFEGCDPSDIPEEWNGLGDSTHMTKSMRAEVLYRAFKRAEREHASYVAAFRQSVETRLRLMAGWEGELTDEQILPYIAKGGTSDRVASRIFAEMMDGNVMTQKYARDA